MSARSIHHNGPHVARRKTVDRSDVPTPGDATGTMPGRWGRLGRRRAGAVGMRWDTEDRIDSKDSNSDKNASSTVRGPDRKRPNHAITPRRLRGRWRGKESRRNRDPADGSPAE